MSPVDTSQDERRRRMRAARALAGYKNVSDLAAAIGPDAGLGERTLRKLESGESPLRPPAMREIAQACNLPFEFFTVDFTQALNGNTDGDDAVDPDELRTMIGVVRNNSLRIGDLEEAVRPIGDLQGGLQELTTRLAALQADHANLATQVRRQTAASGTPSQDQAQPGPPR